MTEKRSLRAEESQGKRPTQEDKRVKRRKLVRTDQASSDHEAEPVKSKQIENVAESKGGDDWHFSSQTGGRYLDLDPVFSPDEKHLLLALENAVQVYSTSTSRVVRTLEPPRPEHITGFNLSRTNSEHIYASTRSGKIFQWNWTTGRLVRGHTIAGSILSIDMGVTVEKDSSESTNVLYALCEKSDGQREISLNFQEGNSKKSKWKQSIVLTTSTPINDIRIVAGGAIIVALGPNVLMVGNTTKPSPKSPEPIQYIWREVKLPIQITCFDVRLRTSLDDLTLSGNTTKSSSIVVDLALGEAQGSIVVYNDILKTLKGYEDKNALDNGLASNKLHWHRTPVSTVRWSKDGNYLISGGLESVLVLWQLDTGRKQFLPHLSSPISNMIVSPEGSSYAVQLADNSTMVLSTSELRPIACMNGLQIPSHEGSSNSTQLSKRAATKSRPHRLPTILHPLYPDYLLMAVPSALRSTQASSFLQTFDTRSSQQVYRQAMARTNVSVLNTGPQGTELTTPDVKCIQISADGEWLATVDEWEQYSEDVNVLYPQSENDTSKTHREVHLKFWHWNEYTAEWELIARFNSPHSSNQGSMSVIGLSAHPQRLAFASVGEDGVLRLWEPDFRSRTTKNSDKTRTVKNWRCSHSVSFAGDLEDNFSYANGASSVCFSEDGSVVAVCWSGRSSTEEGQVHMIDPETGRTCHVRERLFTGTPRGCGFLGRYMVILSSSLVVWDTVTDKTVYSLSLKNMKAENPQSMLAINPRNHTFAVCFRSSKKDNEGKPSKHSRKGKFQLAIFELGSATPLFRSRLQFPPLCLLADVPSAEYILVDSSARILRVGSGKAGSLTRETIESDAPLKTGLEDIFGSYRLPSSRAPQGAGSVRVVDGGVERKSLTDIFDVGPSFALPTVDTLFRDVVDSFATKAVEA